MLQFATSMLAVLVGGIFAAADDQFNRRELEMINKELAESQNQLRSVIGGLTFAELNKIRAESQFDWIEINKKSAESNKIEWPLPEEDFPDPDIFKEDSPNYQLADFKNCTEMKDVDGFVKYDGRSSCVHAYYDAACLNKRTYYGGAPTIGRYKFLQGGNIQVCAESIHADPRGFWYAIGGIYLFFVLITLCLVCCVCAEFRKNKERINAL